MTVQAPFSGYNAYLVAAAKNKKSDYDHPYPIVIKKCA